MTEPRAKILVVDDEPQIRRFLRPALENQGYQVLEAENGQAALVQANTHAPDVILLDLALPDISGIEMREISTLVNNVRNNGPELIEPAPPHDIGQPTLL